MRATHSEAHDHAHPPPSDLSSRRLALTLVLAGCYMVAEVVGGLISNSIALLADAGHMVSDVFALGLSLFAVWIARRPPAPHRSYGYHRAEILAAFTNAVGLIAIAVYILIEASQRLHDPPNVRGWIMMGVAIGGLVVNLGCLWLLYGGRNENLNVRGAWLHVMGDTLGSVGAITAAVLIAALGWIWADPVASALIALLIVRSAWCLLKDAIAILMEGTPPGVDAEKVRDALMETSGVVDVHHLHIWSIGSGRNTLSAHVVTREFGRHRLLLAELQRMIHERFHIAHSTIQIEPEHHEDPPSQF